MLFNKSNTIILTAALLFPMAGHAVSSKGTVKDYCIKAHNGVVTKAQVAVATRKGYKGVIPLVTARPLSGFPNCFDSRFTYKNELKRISFNCTGSKTVLSPSTR